MAARALGIQALFSRAFPLFFTRLPYLEHQNALLWILKWAHHVPTPIPLGSHSGCTLSDGWRLGFPQVTNSPNPLQLGRGGGGLFHGRVLPTSTWYHDDLGHHPPPTCTLHSGSLFNRNSIVSDSLRNSTFFTRNTKDTLGTLGARAALPQRLSTKLWRRNSLHSITSLTTR